MRFVLLDKNCTRQNGILGEPRRLEKWFAYLATLTRKTNWAVVEQHALVHQWRSSSGPKKERLAFLTKIRDSKKWFYGRTNPCCSTTAQFVFLVRSARYANHFSSLLGSPKIPFCLMQFLSSRTSRMRLIFLLPLSQLPENPCCYSTGQCCLPLRTARARNRFPALVRSSVEPFFGISNFGKNAKTLLFWAAAAPPLVHQSNAALPKEAPHKIWL